MKQKLGIPKKLGHIWIGPLEPPLEWMDTWVAKHSNWDYQIYDNNFLNTFPFKNKSLIDRYLELEQYAGAADLMRYEILYEYGGLIPEADSICYHNTDELFTNKTAYTVYENEFLRGSLVSPIQACEAGNPFVKLLIDELSKLSPDELGPPWLVTGNYFVAKMIEKHKPDITIFPSHYFIPVHFEGEVYEGHDKVYAKQLFGTTHNSYKPKKSKKPSFIQKLKKRRFRKEKKALYNKYMNKIRLAFKKDYTNITDSDF